MTQVLDPTGAETVTTEYDMEGRAYRQFDGEGNLLVRIVYNPDGSTTVYDAQENAQTFESNQHNVLTETHDELNRATYTSYDDNFRPTEIENAAGQTLAMEWSADGKNLLGKTDPAGNRTTYEYDSLNNLIAETDPLGSVTRYTYDGKLLTSKTDAAGNVTTYTYSPDGNLATETDAVGRTTTYAYDLHGQRTSVTDWRGKVTTYVYDDLGRLVETIDPRGRVSRSEYNAAGQLLRTITNYDPARPQNAENQYNLVTTYAYDVRGNQVAVTDTLGYTTHYEYDEADHLVRTIDAAGNVTTNVYDVAGKLELTIDALGRTTSYVYDAVGRRLTTIDALGNASGTTTFNIAANTSTATDALGHAATYYYDELNRVIKVVYPLGNTTLTTYDANGNVAGRTDQLGRTTHYEYDVFNRLVRTTDPLGAVTQTIYDSKGNRIATIDALGNRTSYEYDDQGRLLATLDPLGNRTTNTYDEDGNLTETTDALGRTTRTEYNEWGRRTASVDAAGRRMTYTYDALDRVVSTTDPTGTSTTTYNALGNIIARSDGHGRTATTTYDVLGRVISTTDFDGNTTTNGYDAVGNLVSSTDEQGRTTTYTYDVLNRRIASTDAAGNVSRVAYDVLGNVTDQINANGVVTHFIYDALNRQVAVIQNYRPTMQPGADTNVRTDYTYNAVGNRTRVKDANGNVTEFHYDALNRVIEKIDPLGNTWQYEYDLAGNLILRTDGNHKTIGFTYDATGRLTHIDYPEPDADVSFTYNEIGHRIGMTDGLGTTHWNYDELGRLTSVTDPNGKTVRYTYDAEGNRTGLVYPDGKQVAYNFDTDNNLAEVADWNNQATAYEYDTLGRLLSILRPNGVTSTYAYDEAGHLALLEHTIGEDILAGYEYTYDAVGNVSRAVERVSGGATNGPTVSMTVIDTGGAPLAGRTIYAFSGDTYTNYSKVTDAQGKASITLPEGEYRFRVDVDGTKFWSGTENHCEIGKCDQVILTIPQPVLVSIVDTEGTPQEGLSIYAFDGTAYTNFSAMTNTAGQASLRLPVGYYRFRADMNGQQFWSNAENHCAVPGCTIAAVRVTLPVSVLVNDSLSMPKPGIQVYAYNGFTYTNLSAVTDEDGLAIFTLPEGNYRFRADLNGTQFWSGESSHCSLPGCRGAEIIVSAPLLVTVLDTDGVAQGGIPVYVYNGNTYTNISATTDENGRATFTLPAGSYRFRADRNGTQFWSEATNHCDVPTCTGAVIRVTRGVTVTVQDTHGTRKDGVPVYVFNGATYTNFNDVTNANGQVTFTLPEGNYRFRADFNGTQYWSGGQNHCAVPGCAGASVTVTLPTLVTVHDTDGTPKAGLMVYVFNGIAYTNRSATTDANGQATFTLPEGNYRFRTDLNGTQFWSGATNNCAVPGCESAEVTVSIPVIVAI